MIAIYEINRECDTSELTELATYIGHEGVFKTGFRYRELDISNSSIESNTTIQKCPANSTLQKVNQFIKNTFLFR